MAFDRFVQEQLAADAVAPEDQPWRLAAMGFLTLGRMFDNNIHDQIDDRIDTVTRGFLGLTRRLRPVPRPQVRRHPHGRLLLAVRGLRQQRAAARAAAGRAGPAPTRRRCLREAGRGEARELMQFREGQYTHPVRGRAAADARLPRQAATTPPDPLETAIFFLSLAPRTCALRSSRVGVAISRASAAGRSRVRPVARPDGTAGGHVRGGCKAILARWRFAAFRDETGPVESDGRGALAHASLKTSADVARTYGGLIRRVDEEARKSAPSLRRPRSMTAEQIWQVLADHESPAYFPESQTYYYMSRGEKDAFGGKMVELDRMTVKAADASPRAMVLFDCGRAVRAARSSCGATHRQPGDRVPRQFLRVLAGAESSAVSPRQRPARPGPGHHAQPITR